MSDEDLDSFLVKNCILENSVPVKMNAPFTEERVNRIQEFADKNGFVIERDQMGNIIINKAVIKDYPIFEFSFSNEGLDLLKTYLANVAKEEKKVKPEKNSERDVDQMICGFPQQPEYSSNLMSVEVRKSFLISPLKTAIINNINTNQVVLIKGETGSGKTTQVPQYLLDYYSTINGKCRIICALPQKTNVVITAERVAFERGEKCGVSVGYHIRLESCIGPKIPLIFCTYEMLLQALITFPNFLESVTHIILDNINERDHLSDYLLLLLRKLLTNYPNLRLILMFSMMDVCKLMNYFCKPTLVEIPASNITVFEIYIDEIKVLINYKASELQKNKYYLGRDPNAFNEQLENIINRYYEQGTEESFNQLLQYISRNSDSINYQTMKNGYTPLIIAAIRGNFKHCVILLHLGADAHIQSTDKCYTATNWAQVYDRGNVITLLQEYQDLQLSKYANLTSKLDNMSLYKTESSYDVIDLYLVFAVLHHVHVSKRVGNILIFLSDYDDIINLKNKIETSEQFTADSYEIIIIHDLMNTSDRQKLFYFVSTKRKIILTTYVAENGIVFNEVSAVIDCGRNMHRVYDMTNNIYNIQYDWISQESAIQRSRKAIHKLGGICIRLYKREQFNAFPVYTVPEISRISLQDLCLYTKIYSNDLDVNAFLQSALDPPSPFVVKKALENLKLLNALDEHGNVNLLGKYMVNFPIEPNLTKMLIFSVIFQCLDPVLTIVSFLSHRDPFITMENNMRYKNKLIHARQLFARDFFSDHLVFLRVFQNWQESRISGKEMQFLNKNYISSAVMDQILMIRSQLLGYLRAQGFVNTKLPNDIRESNKHSDNWALVKAMLAVGFFPNLAYINKTKMKIYSNIHVNMALSNLSTLRQTGEPLSEYLTKIPSNWLIYESLGEIRYYCIYAATCINNITVALFLNNALTFTTSDITEVKPNKWIICKSSEENLSILSLLHNKVEQLLLNCLENPRKQKHINDTEFIHIIEKLMVLEDAASGFSHPKNVGLRPKVVNYTNIRQTHTSNILSTTKLNPFKHNPNTTPMHSIYYTTPGVASTSKEVHREIRKSDTVNDELADEISTLDLKFDDFADNGITLEINDNIEADVETFWNTEPTNNETFFWVLKNCSDESITESINKKRWLFDKDMIGNIGSLILSDKVIIILFSIEGTNKFDGIAKLLNEQILVDESQNFIVRIQWICRSEIPFSEIDGIETYASKLVHAQLIDFAVGMKVWNAFRQCASILSDEKKVIKKKDSKTN